MSLDYFTYCQGEFIERGARVRVVDTDGGRLIVESISRSPEDPA